MTSTEDKDALGTPQKASFDYSKISQALDKTQLSFLGPEKKELEIPPALVKILQDAVEELLRGRNVEVVSSELQITTQEAADYLGMSRPTFVQLLTDGKIPYTQAGDGKHRRIRISDLVEYQNQVRADRRKHLANMVKIGQEMKADPDFVEPTMEEIILIIKGIRKADGDKKRAESNP